MKGFVHGILLKARQAGRSATMLKILLRQRRFNQTQMALIELRNRRRVRHWVRQKMERRPL